MSDQTANDASTWNIANQITILRLVVSLFLFVALQFEVYGWSILLFLVGATTDWLDGYLARSRNLVTQLGRIMDPLADKIIICGTFIFLSAASQSHVPAWMTVIVVSRELIVTVLRSYLEQEGRDFSAKMPGKIKMVLQCAVAVASLILLMRAKGPDLVPAWLPMTVSGLAWAMVLSTIYSGALYIVAAARLLTGTEQQ